MILCSLCQQFPPTGLSSICKSCFTDSLRDVRYAEGPKEDRKRGDERFHSLLKEIGDLHDLKQRDYGVEEDPLANVRSAIDWGTPSWVGAMIRATDKVRRLQKYAKVGKLANEGARDAFLDLAVYALIALVLWEETCS